MKPFNLEEAKAGKPVCTREGYNVTLCYFDLKGSKYSIVGIIHRDKEDMVHTFANNGKVLATEYSIHDLFMKTTKQQRWINIFKDMPNEIFTVYKTKEAALRGRSPSFEYPCDPIQIEWEE